MRKASGWSRPHGAAILAKVRGTIDALPATVRTWLRTNAFADWAAAGTVLAIAAIFDLIRLGQQGDGNLYYAAAVASMLENWHNFFFVSFDPGGFVSIDKPPVDFWLQAASAKLFGLSGFSLALPQALAGVASVGVLYGLVRRAFGVAPALLATLALAVSPINVAANRDNIVDSLLVLIVLLAAWAVLHAAQTGQMRWLLLGAALVGLGFNVKMLEAYLVVPALAVLYALAAPPSRRARATHLALAGVVLLVVSLAWVTAVDLTPASQRPYVGSSRTNSELNLALGYNGIDRVIGLFGRRAGPPSMRGATHTPTTPSTVHLPTTPTDSSATATRSNEQSFVFGETGSSGPLRLFNQALGNQVSWLLALAMMGLFASGWGMPFWRLAALPRRGIATIAHESHPLTGLGRWFAGGATTGGQPHLNRQQQSWVLWGAWLVTTATFFSVASFFHAYYTVMMAPAICALAGIGAIMLWRDHQLPGRRGWLLSPALALTALTQLHFLGGTPVSLDWVGSLTILVAFSAAALLGVARLARSVGGTPHEPLIPRPDTAIGSASTVWHQLALRLSSAAPRVGPIATAGIIVLLIAPAVWAGATVAAPGNAMAPTAGPHVAPVAGGFNSFSGFGGDGTAIDHRLVRYLTTHQGKTRFLVATSNAMAAAPYVLATGKPIMAIGGFMGGDTILTRASLKRAIANGQVRYFLLPAGPNIALSPQVIARLPLPVRTLVKSGGGFGMSGRVGANANLTSWVTSHCHVVPASQWSGSKTQRMTASSPSRRQSGRSGSVRGPDSPGGLSNRSDTRSRLREILYDCASH